MSFAGQKLVFATPVVEVSTWPDGAHLPCIETNTFLLPETEGRLLLKVPAFFAH